MISHPGKDPRRWCKHITRMTRRNIEKVMDHTKRSRNTRTAVADDGRRIKWPGLEVLAWVYHARPENSPEEAPLTKAKKFNGGCPLWARADGTAAVTKVNSL